MSNTTGITGNPLLHTLLGGTEKLSAERTPSASSSTAIVSSDKARLSGAGSALSQTNNDGDVRLGKVAALKAAIDNGSYRVPASATADKLISSLLR